MAKQENVAVAEIARELACFVWGMMPDNISVKDHVHLPVKSATHRFSVKFLPAICP